MTKLQSDEKSPLFVTLYGARAPKVELALTGEEPFLVFNYTKRDYSKYKDKEIYICDTRSLNKDFILHLEELKKISIDTIKAKNIRTVIFDRLPDLRNIIFSDDDGAQIPAFEVGKRFCLIRNMFEFLIINGLHVILLSPKIENKQYNVFTPDFRRIKDLYYFMDFTVLVEEGTCRIMNFVFGEEHDMPEKTIEYLWNRKDPWYIQRIQ